MLSVDLVFVTLTALGFGLIWSIDLSVVALPWLLLSLIREPLTTAYVMRSLRPCEATHDLVEVRAPLERRGIRRLVERLGGPTGHGPGRLCVWTKPPDGVQNSAATSASLGMAVPTRACM